MKIMVRGKNVAGLVEQMTSEEEVHAFYEAQRDQHPLGEESIEQFNDRNRRFLSALLSVYFGETDDPVEDEGVVIPQMFNYR
ncbi:hypothetical protein [Aeromonas salmonicida]|uniref:hypothetical protein n=1 Tax=Aeromonas salmonicida TaxID=645 RepID=UPI001F2D664F|nr:hypothetical protein [Aeromonas salmonicida]MCE9932787.1 hypothetical protein [Aeromonas salmonicida]